MTFLEDNNQFSLNNLDTIHPSLGISRRTITQIQLDVVLIFFNFFFFFFNSLNTLYYYSKK